MTGNVPVLRRIQAAIQRKDFVGGFHARLRQMERNITEEDIMVAIGDDRPEVIEDYPGDPLGHSCLIR